MNLPSPDVFWEENHFLQDKEYITLMELHSQKEKGAIKV